MAVVGFTGFEYGAYPPEANGTFSGSGMSIDSTIFRTGAYSLKAAAVSGTLGNAVLPGGGGWERFYVRVTGRPATTARVLAGTITTSALNLRLNPDGSIAFYLNTSLQGTSTTKLTDTARWYCIETRASGDASTTFDILRIDGNVELSAITPSGQTGITSFGPRDTVADTYTAYCDDYTSNDAGFPGPGAVVMLLPTSLNAAGGWKDGDGTSAPAAATVATRPPPGVASANEVLGTNIKSATNSASDNCDMNMTTYLAAGVTGVVNAVRAVARQGEDIATGTKSGALQLLSNPAEVSETTFTFGNDIGAHGAEAGSWITQRNAVLTNPSVTLSIAPVLRVGKRTATTRVVCVDFMGIMVDYTPAAPAAIRTSSVNATGTVRQAINRAGSY